MNVSSTLLPFSFTSTQSSSSRGALRVPSVGSRDKALSAFSSTLARCTTSKSNSDRCVYQRASLLVGFAKFKLIQSESWLVQMVSRVPLRYGRVRSIDRRIANPLLSDTIRPVRFCKSARSVANWSFCLFELVF